VTSTDWLYSYWFSMKKFIFGSYVCYSCSPLLILIFVLGLQWILVLVAFRRAQVLSSLVLFLLAVRSHAHFPAR
jgi:hypothetical protein